MKSRRMRVFSLVIALAMISVFASGCFLLPAEEEILAPPLVEPEEIVYKTEPVQRGDMVDKRTITAYFTPLVHHNLYFTKASGRIQDYNVMLGMEVQEGDILIELENETILKRIRDQELVVEQLESKLKEAQSGSSNQYEIDTATLDMEAAMNVYNDLAAARLELITGNNLENPTLKAQVEEYDKKLRDQQIVIDKLQLKLDQLSAKATSYEAEQAAYALEGAQNNLNDLYAEYENSVLRAPISGRVTWMKPLNIGESVTTYSTLVTISDPNQLVLQYDNTKAVDFPVGMEVTIVYEKETYTGIVESNPKTNPEPAEGIKYDYARFTINDFDYSLASSGGSAQVTAILDSREDVIVISKNRVNNYVSRYYVNVLVDGLKVERDVEIGLETATEVEILKGLIEGELLIIN